MMSTLEETLLQKIITKVKKGKGVPEIAEAILDEVLYGKKVAE